MKRKRQNPQTSKSASYRRSDTKCASLFAISKVGAGSNGICGVLGEKKFGADDFRTNSMLWARRMALWLSAVFS